MKTPLNNQHGFTLVEMIIVIIIMGILAAVIVPQIGVTTGDAQDNTARTNLTAMRNAMEIYYAQHNSVYPGFNTNAGVAGPAAAGPAATAFVEQLTQYTNAAGDVQGTKDATHIYGPYIKSGRLPVNPNNNSNAVVCNVAVTDITTRAWDGTGTAGWYFYTQTGVLVANDSAANALAF